MRPYLYLRETSKGLDLARSTYHLPGLQLIVDLAYRQIINTAHIPVLWGHGALRRVLKQAAKRGSKSVFFLVWIQSRLVDNHPHVAGSISSSTSSGKKRVVCLNEAPCSQASLVSSRLRFGVLFGALNDVMPGNALVYAVLYLTADVDKFRQ